MRESKRPIHAGGRVGTSRPRRAKVPVQFPTLGQRRDVAQRAPGTAVHHVRPYPMPAQVYEMVLGGRDQYPAPTSTSGHCAGHHAGRVEIEWMSRRKEAGVKLEQGARPAPVAKWGEVVVR